jgi:hypothetical protein
MPEEETTLNSKTGSGTTRLNSAVFPGDRVVDAVKSFRVMY